VAPATAAKVGSSRPNAAAPSTTRRRFEQPFDAVRAPGFGRLLPTSRLDASINLALEAAAGDDEILPVDADTYGGAVAHANIQEPP
jgi:hypothetical protein